jgi:hypothetical protein
MNFYNQLLSSYKDLQSRKFKLDEASKNSLQAESKAKHYIQLAVASSKNDHYIVMIPEFGSNAKIYVARNGKQAGRVVIDNILSLYPIAVAEGSGTPLRVPAYFQFVGKFDKLNQENNLPNMPNENPNVMMGLEPSKTSKSLMQASTGLLSLAKSKRLFALPKSMLAPSWMQPGPMEDFSELQRKIVGPDPFSLESKINNATKIVQDELLGFNVTSPVSEDDKQVAAEIFDGFVSRLKKLHSGEFNESDAAWVSSRLINDKNGFWIKDPLKLPGGISLSWRYSVSDPQHGFFRYLITSYNKAYSHWASENNVERLMPILDINSTHTASTSDSGINGIRGKTAEQLRSVIHKIAYGDKGEASFELKQIIAEYGDKLQQAYSLVIPYQEGYAAADLSVIETLNSVKEIEKLSNNSGILGILPKLTWLEQYGVLKRKPATIIPVANTTNLGFVSDLEEIYSTDVAAVLGANYKFTPEEIKSLSLNNRLKIGLKTYLERATPVSLSNRGVQSTLTSIIDYQSTPFVNVACNELGVPVQDAVTKTHQLQKISKLINTLFSDINIVGYPSKSINKANIEVVLDKIWSTAEFSDLNHALDLKTLNIDKQEQKDRVKSLIESRLILATLDKYKNSEDWKKYIGLLIYLNSGSLNNQLLEVRYLNSLSTLAISHNHMLKDIVSRFNLNQLILKKNNSSLSIIDPLTSELTLNLKISPSAKRQNYTEFKVSLPYNTLKKYNRG